ncbi:hypothetical protein DFJ67_0396 [Asanoa ferruginea]|uniref:DUF3558 domain-containing protein n=2 Tax=Asanoa ferruginea TaxID=53367 RepID=A0A3D9ZAM5_9ACTN|nr:hypothetical protein DFJ67_0396 [Asanoa ferruginea]GIF52207.1 hypothetical protein Afe04nite_67460 [Asanoa ferruginea]
MSCALLALAGCSQASAPPPDPAAITSPCEFLRDAELEAIGLGPGKLTESAGLDGDPATQLCTFRVEEPWNHSGTYLDSVAVTFLPTTLDVARQALEGVEDRGMPRFSVALDGVLQRAGARLGQATCERLFAARPDRAVQVGFTVERLPRGERVCAAAARLAPVVAQRIPRP